MAATLRPWGIDIPAAPTLRMLKVVRDSLTPQKMAQITSRAAHETKRSLMKKTPVRFTGKTAKSWQVRKTGNSYIIENTSEVMAFLERGTRAHGPVRARFLYIPLTFRASKGWNKSLKFGRDYVLARRVRGIKAMHIFRKEKPLARERLRRYIKNHVTRVLVKHHANR